MFDKKDLALEFEKAYHISHPDLPKELIEEVTKMFEKLVESFDDKQLGNAWSSLGRLFSAINSKTE